MQFFFKKISTFFSAVNFFKYLVIKTLDLELDPDPQLEKMLDPGIRMKEDYADEPVAIDFLTNL